MENKILSFFLSLFFVCSCSNDSTSPNNYGKDLEFEEVETSLNVFLNGLLNGDIEVIEKYFYEDVFKHLNKYSEPGFDSKTYMIESVKLRAIQAKQHFSEKNIRHSYKILRKIDRIRIREFDIFFFQVTESFVSESSSEIDTLQFIGLKKNTTLQFLSVSEGIENILSYAFNPNEISLVLNTALEGGYNEFLGRINNNLFKSHIWQLEAYGLGNSDNLIEFNEELKLTFVDNGAIDLPQKFRLFNSAGDFEITDMAGGVRVEAISLSHDKIEFSVDGLTEKFNFKIRESGVNLYYLDLELESNGKRVFFVYKGFEIQ